MLAPGVLPTCWSLCSIHHHYSANLIVCSPRTVSSDSPSPPGGGRFHVELHFSPGVNCCVQKNPPQGPGFRPQSRGDMVSYLLSLPFRTRAVLCRAVRTF